MIERPNIDNGGAGVPLFARTDPEFEGDLHCALATASPVLITAPSAVADQIAREIHRIGSARKPMVTVDVDVFLSPGTIADAFARARPGGVLLLRNVDRLPATEQPSLRAALDAGGVRVVATTGVNLFARVEEGAFDPRLFYRLNQIHLVPPVG